MDTFLFQIQTVQTFEKIKNKMWKTFYRHFHSSPRGKHYQIRCAFFSSILSMFFIARYVQALTFKKGTKWRREKSHWEGMRLGTTALGKVVNKIILVGLLRRITYLAPNCFICPFLLCSTPVTQQSLLHTHTKKYNKKIPKQKKKNRMFCIVL